MEYLGRKFLIKILFVIVIGWSGAVYSSSNEFFVDGARLLKMCQSDVVTEQAACEGYIVGVQDSVYSGHLAQFIDICYPPGVSVSQLRVNYINHALIDQSKLSFAAEGLVAESIVTQYPCSVSQSKNSNTPLVKDLGGSSSLGCNPILENCR